MTIVTVYRMLLIVVPFTTIATITTNAGTYKDDILLSLFIVCC